MFHWYLVGHFDPRDPWDTSEKPFKPKVSRLITQEAVQRALASFGREVEEFVGLNQGGWVDCNWSVAPIAPYNMADRVTGFAKSLAKAESAVIMTEKLEVVYPTEAQQAFQAMLAERYGYTQSQREL